MATPEGATDRLRGNRLLVSGAFALVGLLAAAVLLVWFPDLLKEIGARHDLATTLTRTSSIGLAIVSFVFAHFVWRVLAPLEEMALPDVTMAGVRAVAEIGRPEDVAQRTVPLLWDRANWIIRRVEHIHFLDRTMVRRRVSVDFRVPASLLEISFDPQAELGDEERELLGAATEDGDAATVPRYIPVSVLRAWPPVLNLDLRSSDGRPVALLSKSTTNALDGRLLLALAEHALGEFADDLEPELLALVHEDGVIAQRAFVGIKEGVAHVIERVPDIDGEAVNQLIDLAGLLVQNTLLWVPVRDREGARVIIKLAYDEPVRRRLLWPLSLLTGFGFRSHVVAFEVGQIGDAGSYHLEIEIPESLEVTGAELVVADDAEPGHAVARWAYRARERFLEWWLVRIQAGDERAAALVRRNIPKPVVIDRSNFPQLFTRRVHFYATGQRSRPALASVRTAPERRGVPLAGAVTGVLVAAALTGLHEIREDIFANRGQAGVTAGTIAVLLLTPGLLAHTLTGPSEHRFATRVLSGIRTLTFAAVMLALAAAVTLVTALAREDSAPLDDVLPSLMRASWGIGAALIVGLLLPPRGRSRRKD